MSEKFSLKDHLFNETRVRYFSERLAGASKTFDKESFVTEVMSRLLELELKDRIRWIADVLSRHLPKDYKKAVVVIVKSLPPPLDPTKTDDDFGEFILAPFGEYVATYGCTKDRLKTSLDVIEALTMRFSMEDSIRYFIRTFPDETLAQCRAWVVHPHYHVRRLVSEGTRPLLPWSGRVPLLHSDTIPLLTILHADKTRFVTRSVANHLNDISKTNPGVVIETLQSWQKIGLQDTRELAWMTKHALRTLVKRGHLGALALLGYHEVTVRSEQFTVRGDSRDIVPGDALHLELSLSAKEQSDVLVDYIIHFVKKNGTTAPKVFKWKTLTLVAGETVTLQKRHVLKADATTFTLYPGQHRVEVQINGVVSATADFVLS